jgi:hypothetical protein
MTHALFHPNAIPQNPQPARTNGKEGQEKRTHLGLRLPQVAALCGEATVGKRPASARVVGIDQAKTAQGGGT